VQYHPDMPDDQPQSEPMTHSQFLIGAGLFEGGLLVVALVLGRIVGVNPTAELFWSVRDFGIGLLATIPMLLLLVAAYLTSFAPLKQIREFLRDAIGPFLHRCRLIDILLLALLAGVCEEILFRGFLYQWINVSNPTLAVMFTNVLFGFAHAVTPMYALLAGFIGLYLTALMTIDGTPNLLIPITAHSAYDFVAFLIVLWDFRRTRFAGRDNEDADASE